MVGPEILHFHAGPKQGCCYQPRVYIRLAEKECHKSLVIVFLISSLSTSLIKQHSEQLHLQWKSD